MVAIINHHHCRRELLCHSSILRAGRNPPRSFPRPACPWQHSLSARLRLSHWAQRYYGVKNGQSCHSSGLRPFTLKITENVTYCLYGSWKAVSNMDKMLRAFGDQENRYWNYSNTLSYHRHARSHTRERVTQKLERKLLCCRPSGITCNKWSILVHQDMRRLTFYMPIKMNLIDQMWVNIKIFDTWSV